MKIVNLKKFVTGIILLMIVAIGMLFLFSKNTFSHTTNKNDKTLNVISGDTLWSIAKEQQEYNSYYEKKDVRYIVNDIKKINNLEDSDLMIGQQLKIPTI